MDYEKKYKNALEWARRVMSGKIGFIRKDVEEVFPELKESDDEKIRKEIISALKFANVKGVYDKHIAWLEKQGEQKPKFRIGDTIKEKRTGDIVTISEVDLKNEEYRLSNTGFIQFKYEYLWELVEQKLADKVEPKFEVGDWIISNDKKSTYQVIEVKRDIYVIRDNVDNHEYHIDIEYLDVHFHLWSIRDTKDGDVLYCKSCNIEYIVMSKGINEHGDIDSYFRYSSISGFGVDIPYVLSTRQDDITPATKEQRDLLFQKMKDAGYEWDADKKELKKGGEE